MITRPPRNTRCVLQEHQRAAESRGRPAGGRLLPPAARLRHHRVPRPPSGPDQLRLQVAAIPRSESDALAHTQRHTHTHTQPLALSNHLSGTVEDVNFDLPRRRGFDGLLHLSSSLLLIKHSHRSTESTRLHISFFFFLRKKNLTHISITSIPKLWQDPQISKAERSSDEVGDFSENCRSGSGVICLDEKGKAGSHFFLSDVPLFSHCFCLFPVK